jgi:hypothetical protein
MTLTLAASGTLSTTGGGTEDALTQEETAGSHQLVIDLTDMAAGDIIEVRIIQMVLTSGTVRGDTIQLFYGAQPTDQLVWSSEWTTTTLTDTNSLRYSIKQTKGTAGISIPWKVLRIV